MKYAKLRNKIKDKRWVKKMLDKLYAESEDIDKFERFECSNFFRGEISAERNRKFYKKWSKQNIRHINFLNRCK